MRRRRQRLQVSTFPFIAVLLCAMGSLILLLLIMDRRARRAAMEQAMLQAQQQQEEETSKKTELQKKRQAEWQRLQNELRDSLQDEKSQLKNKTKAMRILRARLLEVKQREEEQKRSQDRKQQVGSGDRSEKIRTYNFPQNRCTDHRISSEFYSLEQVMVGDLDELIEALQRHDLEERLQNL